MLFFFLLVLCVVFAYVADKYNNRALLILLTILFILITGLRGEDVGIDTHNYIQIWDSIRLEKPVYVEPGFQFVIRFLLNFGTSPTLLLLFCSTLIYSLIINELWRNRQVLSFTFSILMLFMTVLIPSMNIMRQYVAVAVLFYSTRFIIRSQYVKFLIGVLIATSSHLSSVIFIILFAFELFKWKDLTKWKKFFLIILVLITLISIIPVYNLLFNEYGGYFESSDNMAGLLIPLKIVSLVFVVWMSKILINTEKKNSISYISFVIYIYIIGLFISSLGYFFPYMDRVGLPFTIFDLIIWPILFKKVKNTYNKIILSIIILILFVYPFVMSIIGDVHGVLPYYIDWL